MSNSPFFAPIALSASISGGSKSAAALFSPNSDERFYIGRRKSTSTGGGCTSEILWSGRSNRSSPESSHSHVRKPDLLKKCSVKCYLVLLHHGHNIFHRYSSRCNILQHLRVKTIVCNKKCTVIKNLSESLVLLYIHRVRNDFKCWYIFKDDHLS